MKKPSKTEISEVLGYATGLLVGDMAIRDQVTLKPQDALDKYREKWAIELSVNTAAISVQAAWDRGFDRALEPPMQKGKVGRQLGDNAMAIAAKVSQQARVVSELLGVLDQMKPTMQRETIEACSRLMRDMDERLASVAGIPNLPN